MGIDFSLSNLTFDEHKCIHSLKKGSPNDYIPVINAVENAYRHMCQKMIGFGMGARLVPKKGETSDLFAMNGNIFNPVFKPG